MTIKAAVCYNQGDGCSTIKAALYYNQRGDV